MVQLEILQLHQSMLESVEAAIGQLHLQLLLLFLQLSQSLLFSQSSLTQNSSQVPSIDKLSVTVDIRGAWSKAINGTDYSYGYTGNSTLKFNILSDGDFKFNYQITQNSIT